MKMITLKTSLLQKPNSTLKAFADLNVGKLKAGDIIQFERKGYFRVDKPSEEGKPAVLYTIPDGKAVSRYGAKINHKNVSL